MRSVNFNPTCHTNKWHYWVIGLAFLRSSSGGAIVIMIIFVFLGLYPPCSSRHPRPKLHYIDASNERSISILWLWGLIIHRLGFAVWSGRGTWDHRDFQPSTRSWDIQLPIQCLTTWGHICYAIITMGHLYYRNHHYILVTPGYKKVELLSILTSITTNQSSKQSLNSLTIPKSNDISLILYRSCIKQQFSCQTKCAPLSPS